MVKREDIMQQLHGGDVYTNEYEIDYSASLNPLGMPPSVKQAACEGVMRSSQYPDTACRKLRGALSAKTGIPGEAIIFGNGAAELIYALCAAVRPKKALVTAPGFAEYELALESAGCKTEHILLSESDGFRLSKDSPGLVSPDTDIVFLCNPNNPTGVTIPKELLLVFLARCEECGALLVVDECFLGLTPGGGSLSLRSHVMKSRNLFVLDAFTKLYAMPGIRLGFGFCSCERIPDGMRRHLQPWNVSLPAQMAGIAALKEDGFVQESLAYVERELRFLKKEFAKLHLLCADSTANFLFFKGPDGLAESLSDRGILIRDCRSYKNLEPGWYRVAVRSHEENLRLVREIAEAVV